MQLSPQMKRLLWKDSRQILPLVLLLIVGSVAIQLLFTFFSSVRISIDEQFIRLFLIGIPMCYSVGAGAVLIGMEKESGQMLWLNGMPIKAYQIAASKTIVTLIGWFAIWIASFTFYEVLHVLAGERFELPVWNLSSWSGIPQSLFVFLFNSLLLTISGVMFAWRLKTTWMAVLCILPVAILATIIQVAIFESNAWLQGSLHFAFSEIVSCCFVMMFCVLFAWLGWRFAIQYWDHSVPESSRWPNWIGSIQKWFPCATGIPVIEKRQVRLSPSSALIWQAASQHFWVLLVMLGLVPAALLVNLFNYYSDFGYGELSLYTMVITVYATTSWVGWLVFRTDIRHQSARFYAERGISPWTLWWTLQSIPFAFFCSLILLSLVALRFAFQTTHEWTWLSIGVMQHFQFLFLIYSLSQWISFLIRKIVIAAIVAPFVAPVIAFYLWTEAEPYYYLDSLTVYILIGLPLVVTRIYIRCWTDGFRGWRFWVAQTFCCLLLILSPQLKRISDFWEPSMPNAVHAKLSVEASKLARQPQISISFSSNALSNLDAGRANDYAESVLAKLHDSFVSFQLGEKWTFPKGTLPILIGDIIGSRTQLRSWNNPSNSEKAEANSVGLSASEFNTALLKIKERYEESLGSLARIAALLRQSPKIRDQDLSDWLEIALLRECSQLDSSSHISSELFNHVLEQLADRDGRYQSRRRAILLSLQQLESPKQLYENDQLVWQDSNGRPLLGAYRLCENSQWTNSGWIKARILRRASYISYEMLDCLEQGRMNGLVVDANGSKRAPFQLDDMQRRLAAAWGDSSYEYHHAFILAKAAGMSIEYHLPTSPWPNEFKYGSNLPCSQWYGEWEQAAASLKKR